MAGPFITMVLAFRGGHAALPPLPLDMAEPELRPRVALPRLQYQGPSFGFEGPYWGLNKTDQAIGRIPIKKSISKVFAHSHFSSVESKSLRYNGWIILECPPFLIGLHLVEHEGRSQADKKLWNTSKQHSTECNRVSGSGFLKLCRLEQSFGVAQVESPKAAKHVGSTVAQVWFLKIEPVTKHCRPNPQVRSIAHWNPKALWNRDERVWRSRGDVFLWTF